MLILGLLIAMNLQQQQILKTEQSELQNYHFLQAMKT